MITFKDLEFKKSPMIDIKQALVFFDNGYGASVVTGFGAFGDKDCPYELAVLIGDKDQWDICYNTNITSDVLGYLSANDVTRYLLKIQRLEKRGYEENFN